MGSQRGYISVFDLYTHLYFALEEAVSRQVSAATRQRFGERQEPELTVLKGVGPFAVALYRGATPLGAFEATGAPAEGTAVRAVSPASSQAMLRQLASSQQTIGGNAPVGAAVAGDVQGDVNVTQHGGTGQRGGLHFGSGNQYGDVSIGDIAGRDIIKGNIFGDQITTGTITGSSGVAIGRGAQSIGRQVHTGGGDYAEGGIDKRQGTFEGGDQFNLSGDFSGANLTIKATLRNVSQRIGASPHGDAGARAQLQQLIAQLNAALQQAPADRASEAEAVAETARQAVEQATKAQPNKTLVTSSVDGLRQAAQNLAAALPTVLPLATRIAETLQKLVP